MRRALATQRLPRRERTSGRSLLTFHEFRHRLPPEELTPKGAWRVHAELLVKILRTVGYRLKDTVPVDMPGK
jgi:hypothetical protein